MKDFLILSMAWIRGKGIGASTPPWSTRDNNLATPSPYNLQYLSNWYFNCSVGSHPYDMHPQQLLDFFTCPIYSCCHGCLWSFVIGVPGVVHLQSVFFYRQIAIVLETASLHGLQWIDTLHMHDHNIGMHFSPLNHESVLWLHMLHAIELVTEVVVECNTCYVTDKTPAAGGVLYVGLYIGVSYCQQLIVFGILMLYTDADFLHLWVPSAGPTKEVHLDSTHSKRWDNLLQVYVHHCTW